MNFRISDTFTSSLGKLTAQEQKAVKTTAFDLQMNPASPGMRFHRLDRAKDPNFWSIRVNDDIRIIVHKTDSSLMLAYTDHHDKAYKWAEPLVIGAYYLRLWSGSTSHARAGPWILSIEVLAPTYY